MPRYRLTLEYDGRPFQGWQRQTGVQSVQAAVEAALFRLTGAAASVIAAGRTDAGVHALGQVAHVDLERAYAVERLQMALNQHLKPLPVAVLEARLVAEDFHARFTAHKRHYLYRILNRRAPPALEAGRVWHVPVRLEAEHMHAAAQALLGRHDFTSFRSSDCQAPSPVKTLELIHVRATGALIEVRLSARSFLHHQVRNILGTLRRVGEGKVGVDHLAQVLAARNRAAAGPTAPPDGLYLTGVDYQEA